MKAKLDYKPEIEIQRIGYKVLIKNLGVLNFIRFIQTFEKGYGNYTEEKYELHKNVTVDEIVKRILNKRKDEDERA